MQTGTQVRGVAAHARVVGPSEEQEADSAMT